MDSSTHARSTENHISAKENSKIEILNVKCAFELNSMNLSNNIGADNITI